MLPSVVSRRTHDASRGPASWSVSIDDRGLVGGAGSLLARREDRSGDLSLDADRVTALLSVVAGELAAAKLEQWEGETIRNLGLGRFR